MRHIAPKILLFLLTLVLAALMTTPQVFAKTTSSESTISCQKLLVTLHGNKPATSTCLKSTSSGGVTPFTGTVSCGSRSALAIFADGNYSGWSICFQGSGFVNMTDYRVSIFWGWNDQASSYEAGCSGGTFYTNTNAWGQSQAFTPNSQSNFDGVNGHLPNDTLSSIYLSSNC